MILLAAILTALVADGPILTFRDQYPILIHLDQAPGVSEGTPVRKNGVLIGRVERVDLTDDGAIVVAEVDKDRRIRTSEICRVSSSILGDAILEFVPGEERSEEFIEPGDAIRGVVRTNPLDLLVNLEGDIGTTIDSLGRAGNEVAELASKVNKLIDDADIERIQTMLGQTEQAMVAFTRTMDSLDSILGDEQLQQQIREGAAEFPRLLADSRETMVAVQMAVEAAETNLKNLEGLTEPLGERGEQIVASLESAAANLDELLGQAADFTTAVNSSDGTFGKLIRDPELYDNVNSILGEIECLVRKARPIVDDIRVFSDKIAREPSRLGARGAIERRTPIK
jgi:phospholipid/cholesterol/gamma-HCH transport system substrate-binding protein